MSNKFMEVLKNVGEAIGEATPGLTLNNILSDVGAEMSRLGDQGRSEIAAALFSNSGFVLYGPGQNIGNYHENTVEAPQAQIEEQSRGMEM